MPDVFEMDEIHITEGDGWSEIVLADAASFGVPAMVARRWVLTPGAVGPARVQGDSEQLLYVIKGRGRVIINEETHMLNQESVVWVEPGETYQFIAGGNGLEILQGYAPGEEPTNGRQN